MKVIHNPTKSDIKGFLFNKVFYNLIAGDTRRFPEDVTEAIVKTFSWLKVLKGPPQATEETNAKMYPEADKQEIVMKAKPLTDMRPTRAMAPEGYDDHSISGEEIVSRGVSSQEQGKSGERVDVDKDGVEWYGEGVVQEFFSGGKRVFT